MSARHLTVRGAARLLDRSPRTIRRWIHLGDLPAVAVGDGYRIPLAGVYALLQPQGSTHSRTPVDTPAEAHGYAVIDRGMEPAAKEIQMPVDISTYLNLRDAAARVGRSTRSLSRWVAAGELPSTLSLKGRLLIAPADLDQLFRAPTRMGA